jgi:hypothetical protein
MAILAMMTACKSQDLHCEKGQGPVLLQEVLSICALRQNSSAQGLLRKREKSEQFLSKGRLLRTPQVPSLFQTIRIQYRLTCRNLLRQDTTKGEWMAHDERKSRSRGRKHWSV